MSLQLVDPPKPPLIERLIAMGRKEPLALIAAGLAALALYEASGREVAGLQEAARLVLSQPMTTDTAGP